MHYETLGQRGILLLESYMEKPSSLIRLALRDLRTCEKDSGYDIDMGDWHFPVPEHGLCYVCLAGAVIAQTLNIAPTEYCRPNDDFDPSSPMTKIDRILQALDALRIGGVLTAFHYLEMDTDTLKMDPERYIPVYEADPESFKLAMEELARELEREGY